MGKRWGLTVQSNFGATAVFALRVKTAVFDGAFRPPPKEGGQTVAAALIKRPEPCGSENTRAKPEKWYDERKMPLQGGSHTGATRGPCARLATFLLTAPEARTPQRRALQRPARQRVSL